MSHSVRWFRLAPLALVLAAVVTTAHADDPVRGKMMTRVYAVADLVTPINDIDLPCPAQCPSCPDPCPNCPAQCPTSVVPCKPAISIFDPNNMNPVKDILVQVQEAPTGSFILGAGVNSNAGLSGTIILNERNFDLTQMLGGGCEWLADWTCRGAGQECRVETVPGTSYQRYSVTSAQSMDGPKACGQACPTKVTQQDKLIQIIQNMIAPQSWSAVGGCGTVDYYPIGQALVVNHTPEVQEQVANLLEALRRLQDREVAVEVRLLTVTGDHLNDKLGLFLNPHQASDKPMILAEAQTSQLVESLQGSRHVLFTQAPKLTVFNGQRAAIRCMDEQFFVTDVALHPFNGQSVYVPQNRPFALGTQLAVRPAISADNRYVRCEFNFEHSALASPAVPLFPVTTFITPVFEGGAQGPPVPFTQFLQQPAVNRHVIDKTLTIPDGGTAVLYAGPRTRQEAMPTAEEAAPLFCWVPALMELFTAPPPPPPTIREHLFVLVTPRVIVNQEEQVKHTPEVLPTPKVVRIPAAEEQQVAPPRMVITSPMPAPPCAPAAPSQPVAMVKIDSKVLKLDRAYFDRPEAAAWSDLSPKACGGKPCFLSAEEAERFCRAVCAPKIAEVLSRPQIMTLDGQKAVVNIGSEDQTSVTGVLFVERNGDMEPIFQKQSRSTGLHFTVQPTASADHSFVRLAVTCEVSQAAPGGREYQVTIKPADGRDDVPTRTETLRRPMYNVQQMDATVAMLWGRTAVLHFGDDKQSYVLLLTPRLHDMVDPAAAACPACPADAACPACPTPAACPACPAEAPCPATSPMTSVSPPVIPYPAPLCPPMPPPAPPRVMMPATQPMVLSKLPYVQATAAPSAPQVQLNVAIFALPGSYFDREDAPAWAKRTLQACATEPVLVDPTEAERFIQDAHRGQAAKLLAHPKLVTLSGRPAVFNSGGQKAVPEVVTATGALGSRLVNFGTTVTMLPIAMPDGRIHLDMETVLGTLIPEAPFVSEDKVKTRILMRPGQAVLRYLGQHPTQFANGSMEMQHHYALVAPHVAEQMGAVAQPIAAVPYLNQLVQEVGPGHVAQPIAAVPYLDRLVVNVRPATPAPEEQVVPPPATDARLPKLLAKYRAACASGDTHTARILAAMCLEIDPTCFGK